MSLLEDAKIAWGNMHRSQKGEESKIAEESGNILDLGSILKDQGIP
jgi:hypothetical protein